MRHRLSVLVQTPAHSQVAGPLSYLSEQAHAAGTLLRIPLGKRELLGIVWDADDAPITETFDPDKLRPISAALDALPPLSAHWRALVSFAASYYQRSPGEVALAALPPQLRDLQPAQLARRLQRQAKAGDEGAGPRGQPPALTPAQAGAIEAIESLPGPFLLFGATGSGKTEVYLRCVAQLLAREPDAQ
ncbi:MAG: primosomal protein N', partial [Hylemonella sp.]|nr:primosomal protein N' [Hylemonella sp.]